MIASRGPVEGQLNLAFLSVSAMLSFVKRGPSEWELNVRFVVIVIVLRGWIVLVVEKRIASSVAEQSTID